MCTRTSVSLSVGGSDYEPCTPRSLCCETLTFIVTVPLYIAPLHANRCYSRRGSGGAGVQRHKAEREAQQGRQHIESLEVQLRNVHDQLEARGVALADAERAAKNSSRDAAVLRAQLAVCGPTRCDPV